MAKKLNMYQVENYVFTEDTKTEQKQYPVYKFITEQLNSTCNPKKRDPKKAKNKNN
jgi:hypothetical protein